MPTRESAPVGAPVWLDVMSSDTDRTRSFYCDLFGWEAEEPNPDFGGYFNFSKDGVLVAGGMPQMEPEAGLPDVWSVYLASDDAEATVAKATAAGSPVFVEPMAVGELGTMAVFGDPGQAVIGLWQPGLHKGIGVIDDPDTPAWFELHTTEYDASLAFYRDVFGWETDTVSDEAEFRYTTLGTGDAALAGVIDATTFPETTQSQWKVYFRVADADAAVTKAVDLGAKLTQGPDDTPYGRLVVLTDPTGAEFRLIGPNQA